MSGPSLPHIVLVVAVLATVPLLTTSNVVLNFLTVALLIALVGQGWNVLGGYGGQYSFGHAAFFGTGAYVTAILQMRYGVNAWIAFALGIAGDLFDQIHNSPAQPRVLDVRKGLRQRQAIRTRQEIGDVVGDRGF